MQARSISMNWKRNRRTENNVKGSVVMPTSESSPMKSFCLKQYSLRGGTYLLGRRLPRCSSQSWQRHAHAEALGFRDFSSLLPVKENRRQPGNSACCSSLIKVGLTSRIFARDERSESGMQIRNLEFGDRIELFYEDAQEPTVRATVNILLSVRDEAMGLV